MLSLATLLPVAGLDEQQVWPRRWQVRSRWPGPVLMILVGVLPMALVYARFPDGLFAYGQALSQPVGLASLGLLGVGVVVALRRVVPQVDGDTLVSPAGDTTRYP